VPWAKHPLSIKTDQIRSLSATELVVAWLFVHFFSIYLYWIHQLPLLPQESHLQIASLLGKIPSVFHCRCFVYILSLFIWAGLLQSLKVIGPWKMGQRQCLGLVAFCSFLLVVSDLQLWIPGLTPLWLLSIGCVIFKESPQWVSNFLRVLVLQDGWSLVSQGWGKGLWLGSFLQSPVLAVATEQLWLLGFCLACWYWSRAALWGHWTCWSALHFAAGLDAPLTATLYAGLLWVIPQPEKSSVGPWSWILLATWLHFQANWSWLANFKALPEYPGVYLAYELKDGPYRMKIEGRSKSGRWRWKGPSEFEVRIWKANHLLQERRQLEGLIYFQNSPVLDTRRLSSLAGGLWLCPRVHQKWQSELKQNDATQNLETLCEVRYRP
jgi:hypothetical protein